MRLGALRLKLQLACGDGFALGPGKADLLGAIVREGSISGAGRALGMSYRRAWLLVDEMNRCFAARLVDTAPGRGARGGARLTDTGRAMLDAYRELEEEAAHVVEHPAYRRLVAALRDEPAPPANG